MTGPFVPDGESGRLDIIREYLDTEGPGQELSFADQVAGAEARGNPQDRELVSEIRAELEDFLGEAVGNYESVAAMVDEADQRLAGVVSGSSSYGNTVEVDPADQSEVDDLGHGMSV